jgi:hypothetical protein
MRKVSAEEVERLFKFVKSKYVHYFDLQCELVDHLACAIEEEWELNPTVSFENALTRVYARFPITGFTNFVAEQASYMNKYWWRMIGQSYKNFFTSLWATLVLIIFLFVNNLSFLRFGNYIIVAIICISSAYALYRLNSLHKQHKINKNKNPLMISQVFYSFLVPPAFYLFIQVDFNTTILPKIIATIYLMHLFIMYHFLFTIVEEKLDLYAKKLKFN